VIPQRVTIHCTGLSWGTLEGIRRFHVSERGWNDIGYHYVITNGHGGRQHNDGIDRSKEAAIDGKLWTGRPIAIRGAHVRGYNAGNIGIALVGLPGAFTRAQLVTLVRHCASLCRRFELTPDDVKGHYEYDTNRACPGLQMDLVRAAVEALL